MGLSIFFPNRPKQSLWGTVVQSSQQARRRNTHPQRNRFLEKKKSQVTTIVSDYGGKKYGERDPLTYEPPEISFQTS
jgi:hypothetical protein